MLLGTPKSFTCRSVGLGRPGGILVVPMYAGEMLGYVGAGECISCPTVEG
jgi:hypothetical protein